LKSKNNAQYFQAKNAITNIQMLLPASPAIVGIYAAVDNARGVWKAPANVNIENAIAPEYLITNQEQEGLNVDTVAGKSVNVIRKFEGRGPAIVWGARTLAGNDNEWRYISVRRYFNMVEESTKNATEQFVFEPNDINTWVRVKSMINNYLTQQWKSGALMGASTKEAFFVHVGLGETMTEQDIFEGRMIVEIGLAVVRPAEFIILRFMHKMLAES
jgi:phage tail sheath protein FI